MSLIILFTYVLLSGLCLLVGYEQCFDNSTQQFIYVQVIKCFAIFTNSMIFFFFIYSFIDTSLQTQLNRTNKVQTSNIDVEAFARAYIEFT